MSGGKKKQSLSSVIEEEREKPIVGEEDTSINAREGKGSNSRQRLVLRKGGWRGRRR